MLNHGERATGTKRPTGEFECPRETLPPLPSIGPRREPDPALRELSRIRRLLQADLNAAMAAWETRLKISADSPIQRKSALAKLHIDARFMSLSIYPVKPHIRGRDYEDKVTEETNAG